MKIFVAGSTGVVGKYLVPRLLADGHDVVALVRTPEKANKAENLGATPAIADALDRASLVNAVKEAKPDVVIHQLTAISGVGDLKKFDEGFAATNRLRTEGTDNLLAAARQAGVRRFIAQSYCGWPFARTGGPVKAEDDPLDPSPPKAFSKTLAAIRHLETVVREADDLEGMVLRYGAFYGPGTSIARNGAVVEAVRNNKLPLVGGGTGIWSFVFIKDVAEATALAVTEGGPGIYNVVDDKPAPVAEWLPALAEIIGAKPPRRVPSWLGRFAIGSGGVSMMTKVRGGSNAKAKSELGWQPLYPDWRQGFAEALG